MAGFWKILSRRFYASRSDVSDEITTRTLSVSSSSLFLSYRDVMVKPPLTASAFEASRHSRYRIACFIQRNNTSKVTNLRYMQNTERPEKRKYLENAYTPLLPIIHRPATNHSSMQFASTIQRPSQCSCGLQSSPLCPSVPKFKGYPGKGGGPD